VTIPGVDGRDISALLAPQGARRQALDGYDADYADIVDYIIRCTHRIWEQKDIGLIETHYAPDCRIHLMTGPIAGAAGVTANTVRTLASFPDRTLVGEAVIWSEEPAGAYLSSHRITSSGTNLGPSDFGPATGQRVQFTTIADCLCLENRIIEEWLVRDNSALVLDLGLSPRLVARDHAAVDQASGAPAVWRIDAMSRINDLPGSAFPDAPLPPPTEAQAFAEAIFAQCWNHRRFARMRDAFAPTIAWEGPGARRLFGHGEVIGWATALIGSFGNARFVVEHVAAVEAEQGQDIAVRWAMTGTHDGSALYGAPSHREVYILGITHWRIDGQRIAREVTIFDEVALLRQIEGGL
jgi:predicted ester cyclase